MKIRGIKTYEFNVPMGEPVRDPHTGELLSSLSKPWLFLKIETDAGVDGWGEGSGEWLTPSVEATLHEWSSLLIDTTRPTPLVEVLGKGAADQDPSHRCRHT